MKFSSIAEDKKQNWIEKLTVLMVSFLFIYMAYAVFLNDTFTSDHITGYKNYSHYGFNLLYSLKLGIAGGKFLQPIMDVIYWLLFTKLHMTKLQNEACEQMLFIIMLTISVYILYQVFERFFSFKKKEVIIPIVLGISFVNPFVVELFTYIGFEHGIGIMFVALAVYCFSKGKKVLPGVLVFLGMSIYQSYFELFLIWTTLWLYFKHGARVDKNCVKGSIHMLLEAGIPAVASVVFTKIYVALTNSLEGKTAVMGGAANAGSKNSAGGIVEAGTPYGTIKNLIVEVYKVAYGTCDGLMPKLFLAVVVVISFAITMVAILWAKKDINTILWVVVAWAVMNIYPIAIYTTGYSDIIQRIMWPFFAAISAMLMMMLYHVQALKEIFLVAGLFIMGFLVINIWSTQSSATDCLISNKLEEAEVEMVYEYIENYQNETGIEIETICAGMRMDAPRNSKYLIFADARAHSAHRSLYDVWSRVNLVNYLMGTEYKEEKMTDDQYMEYFGDIQWDSFIPSEQLIFEGNTLYWAIY